MSDPLPNRLLPRCPPTLGARHSMPVRRLAGATVAAALLGACASPPPPPPPAPRPAQPGALKPGVCEQLASTFSFVGTVITRAEAQAPGPIMIRGQEVTAPSHCLIQGRQGERTSAIDKKVYALGFEMRLPENWNGRFLYQGNGGLDGNLVPAAGPAIGGAPATWGLSQGFAVISSDAGHAATQGPFFGLDPQARLDYGYQAVQKLTPMAKGLIRQAYGRGPDRSYIAGCSNGGRHALVAASRFAEDYDGFLAGNPGINLPKAAQAQIYGMQQYFRVAPDDAQGKADIDGAVTDKEFATIGRRVLEKCDALDGVTDGMVLNPVACQAAFDLERDVPTCATGTRDGSCLSPQQKISIGNTFRGATTISGTRLYAPFWYDPGVAGQDWRQWELAAPLQRDAGALAFIFSTPPATVEAFGNDGGLGYARTYNFDSQAQAIFATNNLYRESAMAFMTPPDATRLDELVKRRGRVLVYHGVADAVFSPADTVNWYRAFDANRGGRGADTARLFLIPQMNHCSGGPATDQFDMLTPLVQWVEEGVPPATIPARVRGGAGPLANPELPKGWAADRSRPLCPYPRYARYKGNGDLESADSFYCALPGQ